MNGFEEQPTQQRNIPWKPIAIIVGAVVLVVLVVVVAIAFVNSRKQGQLEQIQTDRVVDQVERSLDVCDNEPNPEACRKLLIQESAVKFDTPEICSKLSGMDFDSCIWEHAKANNRPEECQLMEDKDRARACSDGIYQTLARDSLDVSYCERLSDEDLINPCKDAVVRDISVVHGCAAAGIDESICEERDKFNEIIQKKDPDLCESLSTEQLINDCVLAIEEPDRDLDGLYESVEARLGTDDRNPDTDGDGLLDPQEFEIGTDPLNPDTDGDTYTDGQEVRGGYNPLGEGIY